MDIEFVVVRQAWADSVRKGKVYSVTLKSEEGHTLTLQGSSTDIFKGYPKGSGVTVEIKNPQTTLKEVETNE